VRSAKDLIFILFRSAGPGDDLRAAELVFGLGFHIYMIYVITLKANE
jgi:hypothetical protein